jgi:hypothetical protein
MAIVTGAVTSHAITMRQTMLLLRPPPRFPRSPAIVPAIPAVTMWVGYAFCQERTAERESSRLVLTSFRPIFDMMQRLDLTDNERAILITALRRLVNFDPLSPQTQALKAILERLEPQKQQPIPDTAGTG